MGLTRDQIKPALFQSTPPARGATPLAGGGAALAGFQSTPPARGATGRAGAQPGPRSISIHAPREGGDLMFLRRGPRHFLISIHAPREGGDCLLFFPDF